MVLGGKLGNSKKKLPFPKIRIFPGFHCQHQMALNQGALFSLAKPSNKKFRCSQSRKIMDFQNRPLDNVNPKVFDKKKNRPPSKLDYDNNHIDEIDSREIFDLIRGIKDPEHPLTLEELNVVEEDLVTVDPKNKVVEVVFTPTIEHCSLASLIGLCIQVKLLRSIPAHYKVMVKIAPGSHSTEDVVNKQLADKERVAAALENNKLLEVINQCLVDSL